MGVCSRREASRAILQGRVRVDGRVERDPARPIFLGGVHLAVDEREVRPLASLVIAFHKPRGVVTTRVERSGRLTVYDVLGTVGTWVFPVGRLDKDTSGLLIFTNDHAIGERLTDPRQHLPKTYHARVRGTMLPDVLAVLRAGVVLPDGSATRPAEARVLGQCRDGTSWVEIIVTEGRNRQVRRMCSIVGHDVVDLVRVRIGGLSLGELPPGQWRRLSVPEMQCLAGSPLGGTTPGRVQ
jgi:23S rRNA pseudouridine2605 synthase